ncbi:LOW QUALITY PROTEIN: CD177 antigen-like [Grammomys surdaster]|uniref:LOW QUALITY PROTEIN: CD177 antigen-like n=1 Tax=Grammomys surdaster TaxID=491861 RepID=UPI0010A03EA3|nr:LOW QUALITY PROTEIN: CD177 antigen-like [Grammomys surdaster]
MGACRIQYVLLLSLLGFSPCSDTLTCKEGTLVKFGQNFTKEPIEWIVNPTVSAGGDKTSCQETLLLIDVGEQSLMIGSKSPSKDPGVTQDFEMFAAGPGIIAASYVNVCNTDQCNKADSTSVLLNKLSLSEYNEPGKLKCPACVSFKGSACNHNSKRAPCPKETKCYASSLEVNGGGLSTVFEIFGCLSSSSTFLFNNQTSIGIISIKEILGSDTAISSSHVLVPSTLPAWMLGLWALSALCLEGFVLC